MNKEENKKKKEENKGGVGGHQNISLTHVYM